MQTLFQALILISSLGVIISVVLQEGEQGGGMSMGGEEPLFGKNRATTKDATLQRVTVIAAVTFMVSALVLAAI